MNLHPLEAFSFCLKNSHQLSLCLGCTWTPSALASRHVCVLALKCCFQEMCSTCTSLVDRVEQLSPHKHSWTYSLSTLLGHSQSNTIGGMHLSKSWVSNLALINSVLSECRLRFCTSEDL